MPWVTFERDYDWFPQSLGRAVHIAFKAGMIQFATREASVEATRKGVARPATPEEIADARGRA